MTNLALNLTRTAEQHPERPAIRLDTDVLTYAELDSAVDAVAAILRGKGITAGARVAIMLPNVPAFAAIFYAVLRVGGVVVPMNPLVKNRAVEFYLSDSGATLLFAWEQIIDEAETGAAAAGAEVVQVGMDWLATVRAAAAPPPPCARDDNDTAVILYTSGTTGQPKGAQLTHRNLNLNQDVSARTLLALDPEQVVMGCLPLFHVFGLTCALNASVAAGSCLTLIPRFDPGKALEVIERDRVTVFEGVPTMYAAMLRHPQATTHDVSTLRVCISGGAPLPVEVMRAFEATFGCVILEGYGLSETSPVASFNHPDAERKPGSIGYPVEGVRMRLVDPAGVATPHGEVGEIQIAGHGVMAGYWQRPADTEAAIDADGWFTTGDLARQDDDGYYFIVDRKKDLILRGGYNVYPREVEEVLYEHPAVAEAAVIGVDHDTLGEEVAAAVSLKPGQQTTPTELVEFVKARLAAYKYPRLVWIVDELPKTATGKILRREVRAPAID